MSQMSRMLRTDVRHRASGPGSNTRSCSMTQQHHIDADCEHPEDCSADTEAAAFRKGSLYQQVEAHHFRNAGLSTSTSASDAGLMAWGAVRPARCTSRGRPPREPT